LCASFFLRRRKTNQHFFIAQHLFRQTNIFEQTVQIFFLFILFQLQFRADSSLTVFAMQKAKKNRTHNMVFGVSGADARTMNILSLLCICPGRTSNIQHLFLSSSKVFQLGSGSGRKIFKFPTERQALFVVRQFFFAPTEDQSAFFYSPAFVPADEHL
jgi:hypothetical protein